MQSPPRPLLVAVAATLSFFFIEKATFATPEIACEAVRIDVHPKLHETLRRALEPFCVTLAERNDRDAGARTVISPGVEPETAVIDVILTDGRHARRYVRKVPALQAALTALLVLPEEVLPDDAPTAPPRAPEPSLAPVGPLEGPHAGLSPHPGVRIGFEAAFTALGRLSDGYASLGPEASVALALRGFTLGLLFRWDALLTRLAPTVDSFAMSSVAIGVTLGRREATRWGGWSASVSPRLVAESQTIDRNTPEGPDLAASSTDIRLGTTERIFFGSGATRPFLELDGELSLARMRQPLRLDPAFARLPAWGLGLGLGVAWGDR
jgi:hypothetical protein